MTIEDFKGQISLIKDGFGNPTEGLQEICKIFLGEFHIEVDRWILWPTEVEAYCYCDNFKDVYVHRNVLQMNRFGKLYVHRHPDNHTADGTPKGWAGIDICLSDSEGFYFGMLIRAAKINSLAEDPTIGPYKLYRTIKQDIPLDYYKTLEMNVALVPNDEPMPEPVFFSKRIGLKLKEEDFEGRFLHEKLRAVRAVSLNKYAYKCKEELFEGRAETPEGMSDIDYAKDILGYVPANLKAK